MAHHGVGRSGGGHMDRDQTASLTPELWTEILQRVPEVDRLRHVPLVSHRFSEACRDPLLWTHLRVHLRRLRTSQHVSSFIRWLTPRAVGLQSLVFNDRNCGGDADMEDKAEGARVYTCTTQLEAKCAYAWMVYPHWLIRLLADYAPQLKSLEHIYPYQSHASSVAALPLDLGRLSQLTSLRLNLGRATLDTERLNAVVQTLPSLQRLVVRCRRRPLSATCDFPVSVATSCSQLRALEISGISIGAMPPALGLLTALTRLVLPNAMSLPDSISHLTALQVLDLRGNTVLALPAGLTACRQLTRLKMACDVESPVLAELHSVRHLSVTSWAVLQPHSAYWTQLTSLTHLSLTCGGPAGLLVHAAEMHSIPTGLEGMTGLRSLEIYNARLNDLYSLPPGPYLSCLESLEMSGCAFVCGVPESLSEAPELRYLKLMSGRCNAIDLASYNMVGSAAHDVLGALPSLTMLVLDAPDDREVGEEWYTAWYEGLDYLKTGWSVQGRVPPAVVIR